MEFDGTLHINVQQWNLLLFLNGRNLLLCCAVHVSVNLAVLDELLSGNHLLEFFMIDKVVVDAVDFARSGCSCRVRNAKAETFLVALLMKFFYQSAFTDT